MRWEWGWQVTVAKLLESSQELVKGSRSGEWDGSGDRYTRSLRAGRQCGEAELGWRKAVVHPRARRHSRLDGFGHRTNLVDLQQQTVAGFLLNGLGNPLRVGDCEVISHDLDVHTREERGPSGPIILVKGVFNGDHW